MVFYLICLPIIKFKNAKITLQVMDLILLFWFECAQADQLVVDVFSRAASHDASIFFSLHFHKLHLTLCLFLLDVLRPVVSGQMLELDRMARVNIRDSFLSSSVSCQSVDAWSIIICHHQHFERF